MGQNNFGKMFVFCSICSIYVYLEQNERKFRELPDEARRFKVIEYALVLRQYKYN